MNSSPAVQSSEIVAVILAGGHGRRLGGTIKASLSVGGRTLLEWVRGSLLAQTGAVALSVAPRHASDAWVHAAGLPVVVDDVADGGPLAGIAAALTWARAEFSTSKAIVTVPVDVPFIPSDLIARLTRSEGLAVAESASRIHHAVAVWPVALAADVARAIADGEATLHRFQDRHDARRVRWSAEPFDPFFNINTGDDLRAAERIAVLAAERIRGGLPDEDSTLLNRLGPYVESCAGLDSVGSCTGAAPQLPSARVSRMRTRRLQHPGRSRGHVRHRRRL